MKRLVIAGWLVGITLMVPARAAEDVRELGRLFFSPAERAALDTVRLAATTPPPAVTADELPHLAEPEIVDSAPAPGPPPLTLNGLVARSAGPATVWVNGTAQDARHLTLPGGGTARLNRDALEVAYGEAGLARRVKAGQTYDPAMPALREAHDRAAADPGDVAAP